MADVFISYARSDAKRAAQVAKALKQAGFSVWWDEDLPAHRTYSEVIESNLREASAAIVLWSAEAAGSQWVRAEADLARNEGKLIQASLDGTQPPLPFNQVQCTSLKGWRGAKGHAGWEKIRASVETLVTGSAASQSAPNANGLAAFLSRRWALIALGAVVLLGAALLAFSLLKKGDGERPVVAVLPFESLDSRDESLVAGMWEDTRQAIGRNPQLLVLGPNTAEQLAEAGGDAARKAADYLVEASVRSIGDRIRINTQLVKTKDGSQVWSQNFDRKLDDVFALQSEIAREIEGHIRGRLAESGGKQPENIATSGEVYALYSDARAKIRKRQFQKYEEAHQTLEKVVRMDPNFAPGWATLAVVKGFGPEGVLSVSSAEGDARRAIALAPNLAAGHAALGFVLQEGPAAQATLRRALSLDPNDIEAMNWLANSLGDEQSAEKLKLYNRIVEIEPLWWPAVLNKLNMLFQIGDMPAVQAELARVEQTGNESLAVMFRMQMMSKTGDLSGVVNLGMARYRQASEEERELFAITLFPALHQLGFSKEADVIFPPPNTYIPYIRANDPRAMDMFETQHSPESFWRFGMLAIVGARVYLLNDQGPRLAKLYHSAAATPQDFEKLVGRQRFHEIAPGVALALRSTGEEKEAQELLRLAEDAVAKLKLSEIEKQVALARIWAVQGRKDQAIGSLSAAVRADWIPPFLPIHTDIAIDPPLRELRSDPRFEPLRQQILRHLKKERAEVGSVRIG